MVQKIDVGPVRCVCCTAGCSDKIAYVLYPMDGMLDGWLEPAAERYATTIVVVTGMDWEDAFSPWPAKGVPKGSPDFRGGSPEFLNMMQNEIIPKVEAALGMSEALERSLVGVSMSGLFALWQWMLCDTFVNIASLSGSFWYEGFLQWMKSRPVPAKPGTGYFLLGDQEPKSRVKAFANVGKDTQEIIALLRDAGIRVEFQSVPGNHYSDPIPRLDKAFAAIYPPAQL